jgi:GH24 family phage-related lysozyme (muramidase)
VIIDPRLIRDVELAESPNGQPNLTSYKDSLGNWTIGFGHLMSTQDDSAAGVTITFERAQALLDADLSTAKLQAAQTLEWPDLDSTCRQNAIIELIFNMGEHRWMGFVKCRAAIRAKDWQEAHDQLLSSEWSSEVHQSRANRLANYLLSGVYP